jgi:hypothetical protein
LIFEKKFAVILRCSPFFTASLEGWHKHSRPSFETPLRGSSG